MYMFTELMQQHKDHDLYLTYEVLWGNVLLKLNLGTGDGALSLSIKANNFIRLT